jgi:hypothetical protein
MEFGSTDFITINNVEKFEYFDEEELNPKSKYYQKYQKQYEETFGEGEVINFIILGYVRLIK